MTRLLPLALLDRLRREESGWTLIELLTAAAIGTIVVGVAFGLLDASVRAFGSSAARTDAAQRGRLALDVVTQQLRSPVCLEGNGNSAFLSASGNGLTFWSDTTGSNFSGASPQPVVRELTIAGGVLTETVRSTPSGAVTSQRELATGLQPSGSSPFFAYYALTPQTSPPTPRTATVSLGSTVPSTELDRIARVSVAFEQRPLKAEDAKSGAEFVNEVYVRSIDAARPRGGIRCVAP